MVEIVDVAVVGAGAAGLTAARSLSAHGLRVVVLEAGSKVRHCARANIRRELPPPVTACLPPKVGGRVLADKSLAPWPLELGPEFLHGEHHNALLRLVADGIEGKPEASLVELEWPNYYFFGKEGVLMLAEKADEQPDVALMHESFEKLGEISPATFSARPSRTHRRPCPLWQVRWLLRPAERRRRGSRRCCSTLPAAASPRACSTWPMPSLPTTTARTCRMCAAATPSSPTTSIGGKRRASSDSHDRRHTRPPRRSGCTR